MKLSEKIYIAKEKWDCEFSLIAFLLDLDPEDVESMYLNERKKRFIKEPIKESDDIMRLSLSNRALKALRTSGINTVKEALDNVSSLSKINGLGTKTINEIRNALKAAGFGF